MKWQIKEIPINKIVQGRKEGQFTALEPVYAFSESILIRCAHARERHLAARKPPVLD